MLKQLQDRRGSDEGFTLIELLIAIVVVGILSTVVILGIGGLTDTGGKSACTTSLDASKAATVVHFANKGVYPATFNDAVTGLTTAELERPAGITETATTLTFTSGWVLTMTAGGGAVLNTFSCTKP